MKSYGGECPPEITIQSGDMYGALKGATKDGSMVGSVARVPSDIPTGRLTQDTVKLCFKNEDDATKSLVYWALRSWEKAIWQPVTCYLVQESIIVQVPNQPLRGCWTSGERQPVNCYQLPVTGLIVRAPPGFWRTRPVALRLESRWYTGVTAIDGR